MAIDHVELVGLQRAEFARAARLQHWTLRSQVGIALLAGVAVFISNPIGAYFAALVAVALAVLWAYLGWQYRRSRSQAERARRATLLMQALNESLSDGEIRNLCACFSVSTEEGRKLEDPEYYDAQSQAGFARLAEMLEETCFWSSHLMQASASRTWMNFAVYLLVGLLLFFLSVVVLEAEQLQNAARLFCVLLTFLVSAEMVGAALAYDASARALSNILPRLEAAAARGNREADLLMLLSDYNSAVEGAPMFVPGVYEKSRDRLNQLWRRRRSQADSAAGDKTAFDA